MADANVDGSLPVSKYYTQHTLTNQFVGIESYKDEGNTIPKLQTSIL